MRRIVGWALVASGLIVFIFLGGPWHFESIEGRNLGPISVSSAGWLLIPVALLVTGLWSVARSSGQRSPSRKILGWGLIVGSLIVAAYLVGSGYFGASGVATGISGPMNWWCLPALVLVVAGLRIRATSVKAVNTAR
jgi:hypothetical protein